MDNRPIGVFDSGLGGLTAAAELSALLPREHIIYLGDSHNMPYGEKSHDRIVEMARQDFRFMLGMGVKAVFVACGTVTTNALDVLRQDSPVPVFGVVDAAVEEAAAATKNGRIGVLATRASIASGAFRNKLGERFPQLNVTEQACPRFASMIENGIFGRDDPRVIEAANEYFPPLIAAGVDTVILGCTHYPLLHDIIREYMGEVSQISSGAAAARSIAAFLGEKSLESGSDEGRTEYYTTGGWDAFAHTAALMLGRDISDELRAIEPFDKG